MNIRPAAVEETPALAEIHASAFTSAWTQSVIGALLAGGFGLVGEGADGPLGFILCRTGADEAEILTLAVASDARRQGLGAALVAAALAEAQARGARRMFLEVARTNAAAIALYETAGFRRVGERPGYYADAPGDADALVLRRDL